MYRFKTRLCLALISLFVLNACAPAPVRDATFRARPDSVEQGVLRGPFTGQVNDGVSGDPVAGAIVYATWSFIQGTGFSQAAGVQEKIVSTDASGHYVIPKMERSIDGARLADVQIVIYKKGYVAYRSDRHFADFSPRRDFTQERNIVVLNRFRDDYSHARHLRYIGGGSAINTLTRFEVAEAAAELSGSRGVVQPLMPSELMPSFGSKVVAATVLGENEIRDITGYEGELQSGPLGEPDTDSYSSHHFRATGEPETHDIAIRMWQVAPELAEARYEELASTLPSMERTNTIADASLQATQTNIFGVVFLVKDPGLVVLLSCGSSQCKTMTEAEELAARAFKNVQSAVQR